MSKNWISIYQVKKNTSFEELIRSSTGLAIRIVTYESFTFIYRFINLYFRMFGMYFLKLSSLQTYFMALVIGSLVLYTLTASFHGSEHNRPIQSKEYNRSDHRVKSNRSECYELYARSVSTYIDILDDISSAGIERHKGKSIFFLMTSCPKEGIIKLSTRYFAH